VNYKKAGGGGFAAHQDTPAYIGLASDHISAMVCNTRWNAWGCMFLNVDGGIGGG
jgi:hypothetical protein